MLAFPTNLPAKDVPTTMAEVARRRIVTFAKGLTVRTLLDQAFAKAGLPFAPVMELANVEVIKAMVRSGLGLGIIPDGCIQGFELGSAPIRDLKVARTIRLLSRPQHHSLATGKMIEYLRKLRVP
jgi:DNA-binding transcriptional LysR family regulator